MDDASDDGLLGRFLAGDPEGLRLLIDRHLGMVFHTCLRNLNGDRALAEDAAQATFLVLAGKARSLAGHGNLGGWLHRTATFTASNARRAETQRKQREAVAASAFQQEKSMPHDPTWDEARPLLDAALAALRPAQREAVVLCLLEGLTQGAAAHRCGCSQQAMQQRIADGLASLRAFLRRRGVAIPAAALAAGLSSEATAACPADLAQVCLSSATGTPPPGVHALAQGVLARLFYAKLKILVAVVLAVSVGLSGAAILVGNEAQTPTVPVPTTATLTPAGSPVANGLRLVLRMDQTAIREGEPLTGKLTAENAGTEALDLLPFGDLDILIERSDGRPVDHTTYLGGGQYDPAELRAGLRRLAPGESLQLGAIDQAKPGPWSAFAGQGGRIGFFDYRLTAGEYRLKVRFHEDGRFPKEQLGIAIPVWTGTAESNEVVVRVVEQPVDAPVVQGLQVILAGTAEHVAMRLRNASDQPLVVDLGGYPPFDTTPQRLFVVAYDAQGRQLPHSLPPAHPPQGFPRDRRADYFLTLAAGESHWIPTRYDVAGSLPPGKYTVQGVYHNDRNGLADGAPAAALVGQITGNTLHVVVPPPPTDQKP